MKSNSKWLRGAPGKDVVQAQYERWMYPEPVLDLDEYRNQGGYHAGDPQLQHLSYWPDRDYPEGLKILSAGCGANQAAYIAYSNPTASVTGIDLSTASLAHEQYLKERHSLQNLSLHHMPLESVANLGVDYDLILCTGVLVTMPDPAVGLQALASVMHRDTVVSILLYGLYGRSGVYMMQKLFHLLGLEQNQDDVDFVKATLQDLPARHPLQSYINAAADLDLKHDGGIVDTFLHKQDIAHTVAGCLELVKSCGLVFQGWIDNIHYYPDTVPASHPIAERLMKLDDQTAWSAMELLSGGCATHSFFACRQDRPESRWRIDFDRPDANCFIPVPRIRVDVKPATPASEANAATLHRLQGPPTILSRKELSLFDQFDGGRSIADAAVAAGLGKTESAGFALSFARRLWRLGHIDLRLPATEKSFG